MEIERELVREIVASFGPLLLIVVVMVAIGSVFSSNGQLEPEGGQALVAAIVFFVFLMAGIGIWLARVDEEEES